MSSTEAGKKQERKGGKQEGREFKIRSRKRREEVGGGGREGGARTRVEGAVKVLEDDASAEGAGGLRVVHAVEPRGEVVESSLLGLREGREGGREGGRKGEWFGRVEGIRSCRPSSYLGARRQCAPFPFPVCLWVICEKTEKKKSEPSISLQISLPPSLPPSRPAYHGVADIKDRGLDVLHAAVLAHHHRVRLVDAEDELGEREGGREGLVPCMLAASFFHPSSLPPSLQTLFRSLPCS